MISLLKLQRGIILQKDTISILTIYKLQRGIKQQKCRRSNSLYSKSGHTFVYTKFLEIISKGIKFIEQTRFLCRKFKRGIIKEKM